MGGIWGTGEEGALPVVVLVFMLELLLLVGRCRTLFTPSWLSMPALYGRDGCRVSDMTACKGRIYRLQRRSWICKVRAVMRSRA